MYATVLSALVDATLVLPAASWAAPAARLAVTVPAPVIPLTARVNVVGPPGHHNRRRAGGAADRDVARGEPGDGRQVMTWGGALANRRRPGRAVLPSIGYRSISRPPGCGTRTDAP